jgi:hypothetical protein
VAATKRNKFNLGHGLTLEVVPPDGACFPYGAIRLTQGGQEPFVVCPPCYASTVSTAIALRVASRFFDKRAKGGSVQAF